MQGNGFGQLGELEAAVHLLKNELNGLHQSERRVKSLLHVQQAGAGFAQHRILAVITGFLESSFQFFFFFMRRIGKPFAGKGHAAAELVQILGQNNIVATLEQHADNSFRLSSAVCVFFAGAHVTGYATGKVHHSFGIGAVGFRQAYLAAACGHVFVPQRGLVEGDAAQQS